MMNNPIQYSWLQAQLHNNKLKLFVEGTASLTKKIRTKVIDMNGFEEKSK